MKHKQKIKQKNTIQNVWYFCGGAKGIRRKRLARFRNSEESELVHVSERLRATNLALHCALRRHFVSDLLAMRLHSMSANATRLLPSSFVISPQGFRLQSNGAIDIAQSPRIEIKKNPRNIEFVFSSVVTIGLTRPNTAKRKFRCGCDKAVISVFE